MWQRTRMKLNGPALRVIRERSGISVTSLATQVGMKQSHLSNIEAGRRGTTDDKILAIARVLAVELPAIIVPPDGEAAA